MPLFDDLLQRIERFRLVRQILGGLSPFTNGLALGLVFIRGMRYAAGSLLFVSTLIRARLALSY